MYRPDLHGIMHRSTLPSQPGSVAVPRSAVPWLGEPEVEATLARVARSKDGPAATDTEDDDPDRSSHDSS